MAYNEEVGDRLRARLRCEVGLSEKRMFGGLAFLINGNLAVSASSQGGLLLRVDPAQTESLIRDPRAQRFVMRDRELTGWLHIDVDAMADDEFAGWVRRGLEYARALPTKGE